MRKKDIKDLVASVIVSALGAITGIEKEQARYDKLCAKFGM